MKKALSLLLTLAMLLSLMPVMTVSADSTAAIVIEAESMTLVTGQGQVHNMESNFPGSGFSGGKQFWFKNTAVGGVLELKFTIDTAYEGPVSFAHCMAGDFGIFDVYIDNTLVYDELDMYLNAGTVGSTVKHSGNISMGEVSLAAGEHTLKLVCTGKNASNTYTDRYYAGIDCITLGTEYYEGVTTFEAENMTAAYLSAGGFVQDMASYNQGFSGNKQNFFKCTAVDEEFSLTFTTDKAYKGNAYIVICRAPDFGIFDIYFDDVLAATNIDAYAPSVTRSGYIHLGNLDVNPGEHTVKFVSKGKNAKNTQARYYLGVDCLIFGEGYDYYNDIVTFEGEAMTVESGKGMVQNNMSSFGCDDFSGNGQYLSQNNAVGGEFELSFFTERAFQGYAALALATASDFAIFDIYLDGDLVVDEFDAYSTALAVKDVSLGYHKLTPGKHTLKFVCTGKNASGTNADRFRIGVDCLTLGMEFDYSYADIVGMMTDFKALALLPRDGEIGAAATSYDRVSRYDEATDTYITWGDRVEGATHGKGWESNNDGMGYIEAINGDPIEGIVAADIKGAGAIYRSFFATVGKGHIKVYIDGQAEPTIDMPLQDYVKAEGNYEGLGNLVYQTSARGYNNYVPITFNESCKIVLCGGRDRDEGVGDGYWGRYFAFNYRLFDEGVTVEPLMDSFTTEQKAALLEANDILGSCGMTDEAATANATKDITAGNTVTMLTLDGEGAISHLNVKFNDRLTDAEKLEAMQKLELSIYWDGEDSPSVWAPIGDFFGSSMGGQYKAYPMGADAFGNFYSNWYMPYANGARIVLDNLTDKDYNITVEVVTEAIEGDIADYGRFHAKWSQNRFVDEKRPYDFPVLTTEGAGRFLGFNLHIYNITDVYWWGEGDEKFFVDGEKFPSTFGTGSEDYFGYAWCSANYFSEAYHAQNTTPGKQGLPGNYNNVRFHFGDSVPFTESFVAAMEKFHEDDYTQYAATAYWYLGAEGTDPYTPVTYEGEAADWRYMSLDYELDKLNAPATTNVIEGENMLVIDYYGGNGQFTQNMTGWSSEFSGDTQLFSGQNTNVGSYMTLRFSTKEDFNGTLYGAFGSGSDYGIIQLYMDGEKLDDPIDCYYNGVARLGLIPLGEVELEAGAHDLKIEVVGKTGTKYVYGIDCIVLGEHALTVTEAVTPTCIQGGNIEYWSCADCDEIFADIYGTEVIDGSTELPEDKENHIGETELRGDKPATSTEAGYTGDVYCLSCNEIVTKGDIIPAQTVEGINTDVGLVITVPEAAFPGTEITADILVSTLSDSAQEITSINFNLAYSSVLTLLSITPAEGIGGEAISNGAAFGWHYDPEIGAIKVLPGAAVKAAKAVFRVGSVTEVTDASVDIDEKLLNNITLANDDLKIGFTPDAISDSVTISLAKLEFISAEEYLALASDQMIVVIDNDTEGQNDTTYTLTYADGSSEKLYYSSRYDKYVAVIDASLNEAQIAAMLTRAVGEAPAIAYNGDINGDGRNTAGDAALISDMLHSFTVDSKASDNPAVTDIMRLEADLTGTYTEESGGYVTVSDALRVLYISVGIN